MVVTTIAGVSDAMLKRAPKMSHAASRRPDLIFCVWGKTLINEWKATGIVVAKKKEKRTASKPTEVPGAVCAMPFAMSHPATVAAKRRKRMFTGLRGDLSQTPTPIMNTASETIDAGMSMWSMLIPHGGPDANTS
jgi:hypothetical protein